MKKILVPTDFSEPSIEALGYAIELAKVTHAKITVLNTFKVRQKGGMLMSMDKILRKDAEKEMSSLIGIMEFKHNITLNSTILRSNPVSGIIRTSVNGNYDLIVMGTKGASGLKEIFIGSVAGSVISESKVAVLVVPEGAVYEPIKTVVFAISNLDTLPLGVLKPLLTISKSLSAKVEVFHILSHENDVEGKNISNSIKGLEGINYSTNFEKGEKTTDTNKAITEFVKKKDADLLCLIRQKRGLLGRLFGGSTTLKQVFHSKVPLLILHESISSLPSGE